MAIIRLRPSQPVPPLQPDRRPDGPRLRDLPPAMHTTLAAVDISGFGDPARDDATRLHLRHEMYGRLSEACEMTRVPWRGCYHEDRGDGALLIVPPGIPPAQMLDPFINHLAAVLRHYNTLASPRAQLRLRLALHHGQVLTPRRWRGGRWCAGRGRSAAST